MSYQYLTLLKIYLLHMYIVNILYRKNIPSSIDASPTGAVSVTSSRPLIQEDFNKGVITPMMTKGSFLSRKSHSSVIDVHTGSIYILGGTSSTNTDLNDVWILDTFSGKAFIFFFLLSKISLYNNMLTYLNLRRHVE